MRVALLTVYRHSACTLKDVAGGFGTTFEIGQSLPARLLMRMKGHLAHIPSPVLGYLAARAREAGHDVIAANIRRGDAGFDPVPPCDLALVLSSMVDANAERDLLRELTARGKRAIVFGAYASARPEHYQDVATAVIKGEPENLGNSLFDGDLEGVVDAGFVRDLDALPFPDWSSFPVRDYRYAFLSSRSPTLPVASVRGCAFGCGYCPFRVTAPFRQRDPARVIQEVSHLKQRYGVRGVAFRDPLFNLDRDRVLELARGLRPLDVRFSGEMRADRLDPSLLEELRDAGLRSLELGVESVDLKMLADQHRKPPATEQIEAVIRTAHGLGIRVIANFLFGLPADNRENIRATVAWAKRLNTFAVQFTVATPYPGTTLEDETVGRRLPVAPDGHTGWEPTFTHPSLSKEELSSLREWAYVSYHARPRYLYRFATQAARALLD